MLVISMSVELSLETSEGPRKYTEFRRKISITAIRAFTRMTVYSR